MTETVVSSRVLGSANPLAVKMRSIGNSIKGIGCGVVFLIIGVVLIYQSINGVKEYSKIVAGLALKTPEQATSDEDLVKISGKTDNVTAAKFTYTKCATKACDPTTNISQEISNLIYYTVDTQRYEVVKTTTTETRTSTNANGDQVEETVERITYSEEWVTKNTKEAWAKFNLGQIRVVPNSDVRLLAELSEQTVELVKTDNLEPLNNYSQTISENVGTVRIVVKTLPVSDINYIVVGSLQNGQITAGDPFIISNKTDTQIISSLQSAENTQRVMFMVISWVLTFLGLSMLIAPIIELIDIIPFAGGIAKAIAGVISAVIATVLVLGGWLLIKFWYIFLILVIALIVLAVKLITGRNKKEATK